MSRIDDGGPKYPWGNDEWPGLKVEPGEKVVYDGAKLKGVLANLQDLHEALTKAAEHLPKNINASDFGPPAGKRLAADGKMAVDHLQAGFTAFISAVADHATKVERTMAKHYSTEDDNKQRVAQNNDWK